VTTPYISHHILNSNPYRTARTGGNALHSACWKNSPGLVDTLLQAGADPDATDKESGWTSLHRALYWGQLQAAVTLFQANANLNAFDWKGRTPIDLLSSELSCFLPSPLPHNINTYKKNASFINHGDVFSWGSGANYALGTGSTDNAMTPCRLETLHGQHIVALAAGKFHSVALSSDGGVWTWGWGHGGRLGHPESHIHSGESAVITPRLITCIGGGGVGGGGGVAIVVSSIAAAKHHTLFTSSTGDVYSMGSNKHGQLGYPSVDTQPTPKRISSLRGRCITAVAAANKHSAAVTSSGEVFTWGGNTLGQLGYGTSDSSVNPVPRVVEAMKGKKVVAAAAAKRHTLALTVDGEVLTWGHRGVSPRKVPLSSAHDAVSLSGQPITFHRGHAEVTRPIAVAIAAGAAHSTALTTAGVVLTWRSADPNLLVQEVRGHLIGRRVVSISAGKYRTAAVSIEGEVYMWEGRSDFFPADGRGSGSGSKKTSSPVATAPPFNSTSDNYGPPGKAGGRPIPRPPSATGSSSGIHKNNNNNNTSSSSSVGGGGLYGTSPASRFHQHHYMGGGGVGGGSPAVYGTSPGAHYHTTTNSQGLLGGSWGESSPLVTNKSSSVRNKSISNSGVRGSILLEKFAAERRASGGMSPSDVAGIDNSMTGSFGKNGGGGGSAGSQSNYFLSSPLPTAAGPDGCFQRIEPYRVDSLRRATAIAVGEKHTLALQSWSVAQLKGLPHLPWLASQLEDQQRRNDVDEEEEGEAIDDDDDDDEAAALSPDDRHNKGITTTSGGHNRSRPHSTITPLSPLMPGSLTPSAAKRGSNLGPPALQAICEAAVAQQLVDPRTALQVLEYADVAGAQQLRAYCLAVAACNLDAVIMEAKGSLMTLSPHLLAELEKVYKQRLADVCVEDGKEEEGEGEGARGEGRRRRSNSIDNSSQLQCEVLLGSSVLVPGPRPTASLPYNKGEDAPMGGVATSSLEEEGGIVNRQLTFSSPSRPGPSKQHWRVGSTGCLRAGHDDDGDAAFKMSRQGGNSEVDQVHKLTRSLHKKLQQIAHLEEKQASGATLDSQQQTKVAFKAVFKAAVTTLEGRIMSVSEVQAMLRSATCFKAGDNGGGRDDEESGGNGVKAKKKADNINFKKSQERASAVAACPLETATTAPEKIAPPAIITTITPGSPLPAERHVGFEAQNKKKKDATASSSNNSSAATTATKQQNASLLHKAPFPSSGNAPKTEKEKPPPSQPRKGGLSMFLRGELDNPAKNSSGGGNKDKEDGGGGNGGGVAPWSRATMASMSGDLGSSGLGNIGGASNPGSKNHASSNSVSLHDIIMAEQKEKQQQQLGAGGPMYKKTPSSNTPAPTSGGLVKKKMTLAAFIGSGGKTDDQPQSSAWGTTGGVGNAGAPLSTVTTITSATAIAASPPACITPLRRIQDEQLAASLGVGVGVGVASRDRMTKVPAFPSPSPSRGFSSAAMVPTYSGGGGSSSSSSTMIGVVSKWYVPDEQHPPPIKSLKAIQAEESAVKQLEKKFGAGNVRLASSRR